jgi:tricarballylate dehydrogenase
VNKIGKEDEYDVIVVGGGNTALLTALRVQEKGGKVLILEIAPKKFRGGNGYFTTGIYRIVYNGIEDVKELASNLSEEVKNLDIPAYTADMFFTDWMVATEGLVEPELMELVIENSADAVRWMVKNQGIEMEFASGSTVRMGDKLHYIGSTAVQSKGGGAGLSDSIYARIEESDAIELLYETAALKILVDDTGKVCGVTARQKGMIADIKAKSVVLACGGFEANPAWRARYLGNDWDLAKVRGSRYNMGDGLKMAFEIGAKPEGNWSGAHAIFIDAESPQPAIREDGESTSKRLYIMGLVVNSEGKRFLDEGEDRVEMTYARYGKHVLKQPGRIAFQIFDQKGLEVGQRFPIQDLMGGSQVQAETLEELAEELAIDPATFEATVDAYNADIQPGGILPYYAFAGAEEDLQAPNISPPKSGNAFPIKQAPFYAFPVCCGITFTFGGLKVNLRGQVMDTSEKPIPGLYAAGEIIGGLFYNNYVGATGLTAGAVFARIAGANAVKDHQ